MTSTRLSELNLTDSRSARSSRRLLGLRAAVRAGTYEVAGELVAEAILASSLIGVPPTPRALARAS